MRTNIYKAALIFGAALFLGACSINEPNTPSGDLYGLKLIGEYALEVPEPSGLTLNKEGNALWTVSDNTNRIYKISLIGKTEEELNFTGNDLEGIAYDSTDNTLWLVEEQLREIVHLDLSGNEIGRFETDLAGSGNSGLEGICLDNQKVHYILNEKDPALWAKLKSDFKVLVQKEIPEAIDLSGITYDGNNDAFWIVSDQAKLLIHWREDTGTLKTYELSYEKAEGVAFDPHLQRIYIVSDLTGKLYVYELDVN